MASATNFFEYLESFRRDIEQMPQGGPVGLPDAHFRKAPCRPAAGGESRGDNDFALHNKAPVLGLCEQGNGSRLCGAAGRIGDPPGQHSQSSFALR